MGVKMDQMDFQMAQVTAETGHGAADPGLAGIYILNLTRKNTLGCGYGFWMSRLGSGSPLSSPQSGQQ